MDTTDEANTYESAASLRERVVFSIIAALLGIIFVIDCVTPAGIPVWVFYLVPVLLTYQLPSLWTPYYTAGICAVLTPLGLLLSPLLDGVPTWLPWVNRTAGVGMFTVTAYLIVQYRRVTQTLVETAALDSSHKAFEVRETLLLKNAQDVQDLFDRAPCGYHSLNAQGIYVAINQTELDWLGYRKDEVIGKVCFADLITPESVARFWQEYAHFIERGFVRDMEFTVRRGDGILMPVLVHATAIKDSNGRFIASRSTLVDITYRKRAEDLLRRSHERLEVEVQERTEELRLTNERLEQKLLTITNMQATLKSTEDRFQVMADHAPVLIWISDLTQRCIWVNNPWLEFVGRTRDQDLGDGWVENVHSDDIDYTLRVYDNAFRKQHEFRMEYRLRRHDGEWRWLLNHGVPRFEGEARFVGFIGSCIDITEQKAAIAAAHDSEQILSGIFNSAMDAIITINECQEIVHFNAAAESMFGRRVQEIIGQPVAVLLPERYRTAHSQHVLGFSHANVSKRQMGTLGMISGVRANGEEFPIEASISQITSRGQKLFTVILRDITARKRTEDLMAQQRQLIELSYEPIFAWDVDMGIVEWNRGCEQLYGYSRSEALGHNSVHLLQSRLPSPLSTIQTQLETTGEWTGEIHHRTKDGRDVLVASRWGLLKMNGRSLVLETDRDITARRRAELMILRKNMDLATLLYVTSHDLKEPLRAIEGFSVLVQKEYANRLDERGQDFLRRVIRATQRLNQLLEDILELSRAQRMESPVDDIDAEQLVQEALDRLENRIKETGAHITIRSPLPCLRVNTTWAVQGIYNLLSNALKFASAGQPPDIEIAPYCGMDLEGTELLGVIVRDRGPGVAPGQRDRIFELFRRAVGREIEGTGAGLAIVRQVAERHGGRAWVEPREGGGSDFIISFGASQPGERKVQR